jgi:hypothetical protein
LDAGVEMYRNIQPYPNTQRRGAEGAEDAEEHKRRIDGEDCSEAYGKAAVLNNLRCDWKFQWTQLMFSLRPPRPLRLCVGF